MMDIYFFKVLRERETVATIKNHKVFCLVCFLPFSREPLEDQSYIDKIIKAWVKMILAKFPQETLVRN